MSFYQQKTIILSTEKKLTKKTLSSGERGSDAGTVFFPECPAKN
jgi:hypothetical protein